MRAHMWLGIAVLALLLVGCGGSGAKDPLKPGRSDGISPPADLQRVTAREANRYLWGFWKVEIGADRQSAGATPLRLAEMHLNTVRLLEVTPCRDCLTIDNIVLHPPNELTADLTLRHPFPGLLRYTGFDVRGIFISGADYAFPVSGRSIAWGSDRPRMLIPDGYTALFNPTEFPEGSTAFPALAYI